jgi:hypothetical protein
MDNDDERPLARRPLSGLYRSGGPTIRERTGSEPSDPGDEEMGEVLEDDERLPEGLRGVPKWFHWRYQSDTTTKNEYKAVKQIVETEFGWIAALTLLNTVAVVVLVFWVAWSK